MINIYVGNLPYSARNEDLKELFEEFGEVNSAEIIFDRRTKRSRGYGFVEMVTEEDGKEAIDGALTYYNDVVDILNRLLNDPDHPFAVEARDRITKLKKNNANKSRTSARNRRSRRCHRGCHVRSG